MATVTRASGVGERSAGITTLIVSGAAGLRVGDGVGVGGREVGLGVIDVVGVGPALGEPVDAGSGRAATTLPDDGARPVFVPAPGTRPAAAVAGAGAVEDATGAGVLPAIAGSR